MDLKQVIKNYKKKNRNSFEILQYLLYIDIPNLKKQFKNCETAVNQEALQNIENLYIKNIENAEKILTDILEVKRATLKDLEQYVTEFDNISKELLELEQIIELFRENILTDNQVDNGVKIFIAETSLLIARNNIDLVIAKINKK